MMTRNNSEVGSMFLAVAAGALIAAVVGLLAAQYVVRTKPLPTMAKVHYQLKEARR